ncbi:MAG: c-type cytochrome [Myxococcota bacterium]
MLLTLLACGPSADVAEQGRRVYQASCTACHNPDPTLEGSVGPAVAGSSRELIEARVLRGEYPPGYGPKRPTRLMPPLPVLAPQIDALAAYLEAAAQSSGERARE